MKLKLFLICLGIRILWMAKLSEFIILLRWSIDWFIIILCLNLILAFLQWWKLWVLAIKTSRQGPSTRHIPSTIDFLQIISIHRIIVVLLVHLLFRNAARVVEQSFSKSLVLSLDPLILPFPDRNVQGTWPNRITLSLKSEVAIGNWATKIRYGDIFSHGLVFFLHFPNSFGSHCHTWPFSARNLNQLV